MNKANLVRAALLGVAVLVFYSCDSQVATQPPPPVNPATKYNVLLFSAQWCENCTAELTALKPMWATEAKETTDHYKVKLYVEEGAPGVAATDEVAQQYKQGLGLDFETVADTSTPSKKWQTYRASVTNDAGKPYTWNLPAAVVQTAEGKKVKVFVGGDPQGLMTFLRELVKGQ